MVEKLEKIEIKEEELATLRGQITDGTLQCSNKVVVDGDNRFWDIPDEASPIIKKFRELAELQSKKAVGKTFKHIILMVNHIDYINSPEGSGGGWHVDSVRNQYKLFMYLTDCNTTSYGPLTILSSGNCWKDKFYIIKNYLNGNKFRFTESTINLLKKKGFYEKPILEKATIPFFVNTSFIHRGAKIKDGERMLITAYMFDDIPESIKKRIMNNEY